MAGDLTAERFPLAQLTPQSATARKVAAIFSSPGTLGAPPQTVQSGAGRWGLAYRSIRIATPAQRLVARAFLSKVTSPLRPLLVSPMEWLTSPRRIANLTQANTAAHFSDGAPFSDKTLFEGDAVDFTLSAAAAYFDRTIYVTPLSAPLRLQGGQFIEIARRLYLIETSQDTDDVVAGGQALTIWPPLRADAAAGDPVEAENPHCLMRLDPQSAEMAVEMTLGRYGYFDLTFVEDDWTI